MPKPTQAELDAAEKSVIEEVAPDYTMASTCAKCGEGIRVDLLGQKFCPEFDKRCPRYLEEVA